mgnify:CR=1 FL=1
MHYGTRSYMSPQALVLFLVCFASCEALDLNGTGANSPYIIWNSLEALLDATRSPTDAQAENVLPPGVHSFSVGTSLNVTSDVRITSVEPGRPVLTGDWASPLFNLQPGRTGGADRAGLPKARLQAHRLASPWGMPGSCLPGIKWAAWPHDVCGWWPRGPHNSSRRNTRQLGGCLPSVSQTHKPLGPRAGASLSLSRLVVRLPPLPASWPPSVSSLLSLLVSPASSNHSAAAALDQVTLVAASCR